MSVQKTSPWLNFFHPNPCADLRLFCFPYAGAGSSVFRSWATALPSEIEVCGIQYPGRENRTAESPFRSLSQLLDSLLPAILPALDKPFIFFGHSMGALVSYQLTRVLTTSTGYRPEHLFVSGAGAPHTPPPSPISQLRDREFLKQLVRLNGIPLDVLRSADLIRCLLPILRADFTMCESYRYDVGAPLQCMLTAFGGECDPRVAKGRLNAWSDHASSYFSSVFFPGDHFFVRTARSALLGALLDELQPLLNAVKAAA